MGTQSETRAALQSGFGRRQFLVGGGAITAAGLLAACTGNTPTPSSSAPGEVAGVPARGGTLKLAFNADAEGPASPLHPPGTGQLLIVLAVYDTLFVVDRTQPGFVLKPRLATGYQVSDGGTKYTIPLRQDVKFHNGQPMTARDVVYTLSQNLTSAADLAASLSPYLEPSGIKAVDDNTVELTLKKPNTFLMYLLQEYRVGIFPEGTKDFTHPVGTGPFKFVSRSVNVGFQLTRNENYFIPDQPYLDAVSGIVIPQVSNAIAALKQGKIDWVQTSLPASLSAQLKSDPSVQLVGLDADFTQPIFLNPEVKPFDDVRVRQAVKLCIDRQQWSNVLWGGNSTLVSDIPVQPGDPMGPSLALRQRNIADAKQLLADAGYPNGIDFTIATADDGPAQAQGPVVLAQMAKDAGIRIKVDLQPVSTYYGSKSFGAGQAWADYVNRRHVSVMVEKFMLTNSPTFVEWEPPSVQQRFNEALATTVESEQARLFSSIFEDMSNESGVLIPVLGDSTFALSPNVRGFDANAVSLCGYFGQMGLA